MDLEIFQQPTGYKITEQFFVQRLIELLHRQTIDSYRLRVMNPYLILHELEDIYRAFLQGSVKNFETLDYCIREVVMLIDNDDVLEFKEIHKNYFAKELLLNIKKDNARDCYFDVSNAIKLVFRENKNYTINLISKLEYYIQNDVTSNDAIYLSLEKIDRLTSNLATELIRLGYSKSYLYRYFHKVFIFECVNGFKQAFASISHLISTTSRDYKVWFKIVLPRFDIRTLSTFNGWEIQRNIADLVNEKTPADIRKFVHPAPGRHLYLGVSIRALDHFSALAKAKQCLSENFDILQLAYHREEIRKIDKALVIDLSNPDDLELQVLKYILDGKYPLGKEALPKLQTKVPEILNNTSISGETKQKIKSAVRYLRYGNESFEVEHQFINYWIGLEYLFSNDRDSTFTRIKETLPALQVLLYTRRNMVDFFSMIQQPLRLFIWTHFDPNDIRCLLKIDTFEEISKQTMIDYPLISYRSWKLKNRLFEKDKRSSYLKNHQDTLEQHLVRIYRFRNEIVHEARHGSDNQTLASNLKYYLTFTLSLIIDHFSRLQEAESATLEDFFALQRLKLGSIKSEKYPLEKLLELEHDFEMLT